jgi:hypothetical protein
VRREISGGVNPPARRRYSATIWQWPSSSVASHPRTALVGKHRLEKVIPRRLREHLDRAHQVVDRHAAQHGVEIGSLERQRRFGIEVSDDTFGRHRIGLELGGIHSEDDEFGRLRWKVGHPRRHQVQHASGPASPADTEVGVELAHGRDGSLVDMRHQAGGQVKARVRRGVVTVKEPLRKVHTKWLLPKGRLSWDASPVADAV